MFLRTITLLITIALFSTANAQEITWKIEQTLLYNRATKKSIIDSFVIGEVVLDTSNKIVWFAENKKMTFFYFNNCQKKYADDPHMISYELNDVLHTSNGKITISYSDDGRFLNRYDGVLTVSVDSFVKKYYLSSTGFSILSNTYLKFLDSFLDKIYFPWIAVGENKDGDISFVKGEPLEIDYEGKIKVWIKQLVNTERIKGVIYKNVEKKFLMTFDCRKQRLLMEDYIFYDRKGKVLASSHDNFSEWQTVIPDSMGELLLNKVCALFDKR